MFVLPVMPVRAQKEVTYGILRNRLDTVLPLAMRAANIDMWLIICQEDNLDPVFKTMIPMDTFPKILQILVFHDNGSDVERINLSMTDTGDLYDKPWSGGNHPEQWSRLKEIIKERDPERIGLNIGDVNWASGGLTYNLYNQLVEVVPEYVDRFTSTESVCTRWLMTLTKEELDLYPDVSSIARRVIAYCYSPESITPGITTVEDLEWLFWQTCTDNGIEQSFKPYYRIIRSEAEQEKHPIDGIIRRGDLLVCDVGTRYLGLITDHQELAYVRHVGETDAPKGLKKLLTQNHRLQEVFMREFKHGLTGNQLLANMLSSAEKEGIPNPWIFSHSLGLLLHEPGPLIGLPWDHEPIPGRGDVQLEYNSCYAMELSIKDNVLEWGGQLVPCQTEHIVVFTEDGCKVIDGVQTEFHLI
jgi:hypothetical protein